MMTLSHENKQRILLALNRYAGILHSKTLMEDDPKRFKDYHARFLEVQNFAADFTARLFDNKEITKEDKVFLNALFEEKITYLQSIILEDKFQKQIEELKSLVQLFSED